MAFCRNCGNQLTDGAKFCPKCGNKTDDGREIVQPTYQPETESDYSTEEYDELDNGLKFISFIIPLVGFIIYFNNWATKPVKARSGIVWALYGIFFSWIFWWLICWMIMNVFKTSPGLH
jgi:uncharacterized membrane protein YvbJ